MKILLVSVNFAPELTGIGKYSGEMVDGLLERGHEVTVVCAPPYYPSWQVQAGYSSRRYRTERPRPGLTIRRCPVWIPRRLSGASRLLHLASFALSSLPVLLYLVAWQPRVVFGVAPALFCAPGAWLTARLAGAKAWLHVQDFEVDAAFELGLLRHPGLRKAALFAERLVLQRFDVVSTISRRMLHRLAAKGIAVQHTESLPNWVDLTAVTTESSSLDLRRSLHIGRDQVVCLFSGTMNRKQGLPIVIEAARMLRQRQRSDLVIVLCGNGEMRQELEASARGLANVRFLDLQPTARFNALLSMADMHVLPQLRGAADLVMPSKLIGMLASGRPVVACAAPGTEIASIVNGCGIVVEPECAPSLAEGLAELACDAPRRKRLGVAAREYAQRSLDSRGIFDRLHERLQGIALVPPSVAPPVDGLTSTVRFAEPSQ